MSDAPTPRVRERIVVTKVDVSGDEARVVEEVEVVLIDGVRTKE